jgi:hypothetical protein
MADRRRSLDEHITLVGTAIDRLAEEWEDSRGMLTDEHKHVKASSRMQRLMDDVYREIADMEGYWRLSAPDKDRRRKEYIRFRHWWVAECIAAYRFRMQVISRINSMFAQRVLAARYGVSKRCVEDHCEGRRGIKQ